MKLPLLLPLCVLGAAQAASLGKDGQIVLSDPSAAAEADRYLIELAPGETRWVKGTLLP
jgi:hypothetical protein